MASGKIGQKLQMRRTLPNSVDGHFYGFVALRGHIRCSTELTRYQLVRESGETPELAKVGGTEGKVHGPQDLVQVGGGH